MKYTWELTEQDIEKCKHAGVDIDALQEAKKRAFIENGGVIINPDALDDLYEALKELLEALGNPMEIPPVEIVTKASQALAKAEVKR